MVRRRLIYVDSSVFIYAFGGRHPNKSRALEFFAEAARAQTDLVISAEVLQELLHVWKRRGMLERFDRARTLMGRLSVRVEPLEDADVDAARGLAAAHPELESRDLCHLAVGRRISVRVLQSFDAALMLAFNLEINATEL